MSPVQRNKSPATTQEKRLWQVKIALVATAVEHEELLDRLGEVLCPDPDHEGPCPVPWAMHSLNQDGLSPKMRVTLIQEIEETNLDQNGRPVRLD